ncbi:chemical-damaging agent resistance protein C [Psittacicella hinzii]|uniref:Chemical-damaging agent resistance protein C n=1 Tax=Psittacicella hinzii TaxID=2028575 RepID=A0A3A1Y7N9_9GAMM|nr:TerD family protein [Psittacicella hinzii]RIY32094.1 chemical-damaging agent resistance protein C [Psittacicella hinzii]
MAISLTKGGNVNLSKEAPSLRRVLVGLGWDVRATDGEAFDLDASAFLIKADNKVRSDADFIFYNQLKSVDGSVVHQGDNRTGAGDGDDEALIVDLNAVPAEIQRVVFTVTIYSEKQTFGQVSNAFIRLVNDETGVEVARYDLGEDFANETALIFGELYRHSGDWKFRAVGQGFNGGLRELAKGFGVNI